MSKVRDIAGKRFGRLVALNLVQTTPTKWLCKCDCGNTKVISLSNLSTNHTKSCGCLSKDTINGKTHGMSKTKEHSIWCTIIQRCRNTNSKGYKYYGGRGVMVQQSFVDDFQVFYDHVGPMPGEGYSLDRIDNSKGYEEGNLRWTTDDKQARNKRMHENNSSGFTGVGFVYDYKSEKFSAVATWYYSPNKKKTKSFSIKKYGLLEAIAMACSYREQKIKELNDQGFGYTENHGR